MKLAGVVSTVCFMRLDNRSLSSCVVAMDLGLDYRAIGVISVGCFDEFNLHNPSDVSGYTSIPQAAGCAAAAGRVVEGGLLAGCASAARCAFAAGGAAEQIQPRVPDGLGPRSNHCGLWLTRARGQLVVMLRPVCASIAGCAIAAAGHGLSLTRAQRRRGRYPSLKSTSTVATSSTRSSYQ